MNVSDDELVAEYEKRIADGTDLVGLIPVRSTPSPHARRSVFSVRLGSEELALISGAAHKQGLSIGDFIREAAKRAATEVADLDAGEYSLESFKADYEALGRKLDSSIANSERMRRKPERAKGL
jgi:uncharacterized protein (DUF1778 family)